MLLLLTIATTYCTITAIIIINYSGCDLQVSVLLFNDRVKAPPLAAESTSVTDDFSGTILGSRAQIDEPISGGSSCQR